jgi:AhpD family alkylhydroperoxidase
MTAISRFPVHDELSAPAASALVLRGALASAGQLPNFLGVLAGSPAALRGYARLRSELRHGSLEPPTVERIALAVAGQRGSAPSVALHARAARLAGLTHDEIAAARRFSSADPAHAALLRWLAELLDASGPTPAHLLEEARELGWTDEQLLEATAVVALETFTSLVNLAGDVPADGSVEQARLLAA